MKLIRFRRLSSPVNIVNGVIIEHWETALSQEDLWCKLNGEMAEIIMPAKPWYVRLWRKFFPLKAING